MNKQTEAETRRWATILNSLDPLVLRAGWEFIERGWWTHDLLGGVVYEGKRWGCYPLDLRDHSPAHSEPTRDAAMKWIEERYTANASVRGGGTPYPGRAGSQEDGP